ncbi:MAG: hypothetical protein JST30_03645 [Armatimonadetes bacterium]|nr:hypothetical protein [Armatimonadota bacterium]
MISPFDWQEAITHRAQFIESRIAAGIPVLALSVDAGIVTATYRKRVQKVYEVYDRLMYAGIGQQSDIESLRVAAVDFSHREGFQRSENDVSIQRVVNALSQPVKEAFANFSSAPWVARAMFMEVGSACEDDRYYCLDYDGDFSTEHMRCCLAAEKADESVVETELEKIDRKAGLDDVVAALQGVLERTVSKEKATDQNEGAGLVFEAAVLLRDGSGDRRFRLLRPA